MGGGHKEQVSREGYIQGIAISTAVFCLPSLIKEISWLHGFVPLPVFYYLIRFGRRYTTSILNFSVPCAVLIGAVFGSLPTLLFSFTLLPLGFVLAKAATRKETVNQAGLKGIIYLVATWLVLGGVLAVIHHSNPYTELLKSIDLGLEAAYSQYVEVAQIPTSMLQEIESAFEQLKLFIAKMFPALILTSILFTVWINLVLGNWLLKKKAPSFAPWNNFRDWRLPEPLVWLVIAAILAILLPILQPLKTLGLNTAFVMGVLYFFQGLAILTSLLAKWSVPLMFRLFIYALILVQVYGIILLALIGLADVWADFRKMRSEG